MYVLKKYFKFQLWTHYETSSEPTKNHWPGQKPYQYWVMMTNFIGIIIICMSFFLIVFNNSIIFGLFCWLPYIIIFWLVGWLVGCSGDCFLSARSSISRRASSKGFFYASIAAPDFELSSCWSSSAMVDMEKVVSINSGDLLYRARPPNWSSLPDPDNLKVK